MPLPDPDARIKAIIDTFGYSFAHLLAKGAEPHGLSDVYTDYIEARERLKFSNPMLWREVCKRTFLCISTVYDQVFLPSHREAADFLLADTAWAKA